MSRHEQFRRYDSWRLETPPRYEGPDDEPDDLPPDPDETPLEPTDVVGGDDPDENLPDNPVPDHELGGEG